MSGIFPDGGVTPANTSNTVDVPTTCLNELFYAANTCTPRFDHAAQNAIMSEVLNLLDSAGHVYDCDVLTNLATAVNSLINIPNATLLVSGIVELATDAETIAGLDGTRAVTPLGLAAALLVNGARTYFSSAGVPAGAIPIGSIYVDDAGTGSQFIRTNDGAADVWIQFSA